MKIPISKTRCMYLLALVIALSVLAWDKLCNTPDASNGSTSDISETIPSAPDKTTPPQQTQPNFSLPLMPKNTANQLSSTPTTQKPPLAQRMLGNLFNTSTSLPSASETRDLFIPGRPFTSPPEKQIEKRDPPPLRLQSILIRPGANRALLNGQIVAEGDKLKDITILQIESDNILVGFFGQVIRIMLDKTPAITSEKTQPKDKSAKLAASFVDLENSESD
jgi:hypothetical protein